MGSLKTWVAFLGALVSGVTVYVADDAVTADEWFLIGSLVFTTVGVYFFPNKKAGKNVQDLADEALTRRNYGA